MTYITITCFDTREEYCAFLACIISQGFRRHHSAHQACDIIRKRDPITGAKRIGYATPYIGKYGRGWRIHIHEHSAKHSGDNVVTYYTV